MRQTIDQRPAKSPRKPSRALLRAPALEGADPQSIAFQVDQSCNGAGIRQLLRAAIAVLAKSTGQYRIELKISRIAEGGASDAPEA